MKESPWLAFSYQYLIGGTVFVIGIALAAANRQLKITVKHDRLIIAELLGGLVFFIALQGFFILMAGV